jgi:hypothetical protein
MESPTIKEEAQRLIEKLPDDATWDDVMHEIYVRQAGLADSEARIFSDIHDAYLEQIK